VLSWESLPEYKKLNSTLAPPKRKQFGEKIVRILERDEEKCVAVFRPHPVSQNIGIDHVHDFGSIRSKIIAI
jgi:hypothetical protein